MVVAGCDVFGGIFLDFFEHGSAMVRCSIEQREECLWDAALFALWNITWIWHLGCAFWCSLLYLGLSAKQSQLSAAVSSCQQLSAGFRSSSPPAGNLLWHILLQLLDGSGVV